MKVEVCVPAGRQRYLSILERYLRAYRDEFDHVNLWSNAWESKEDLDYVHELVEKHPDVFKLVEYDTPQKYGNFIWYSRYYKECTDPDTVYVKMDDDIVWMEKGAIRKLAQFRVDHPEYFIVIGNIINNGLLMGLHEGSVPKTYIDGIYDSTRAKKLHEQFLSEGPDAFRFDKYIVEDFRRAPNHVYARTGADELTTEDDENIYTTTTAARAKKKVCYFGDAMFVHFAYTPQHKTLMGTDLLKRYEELAPL